MEHKGLAPLVLDDSSITEITYEAYNARAVNGIASLYKGYRQESKAP